jgi:dienelactone hydrolase
MKIAMSGYVMLALSGFLSAAIHTQAVEYKQGSTALEGYLAYDSALEGRRPGVLVIHEWTGLGDYVKKRAETLAGMGYVAFCADIYGKGIRPQTPDEAGRTAGVYKNDRTLTRLRAQAALDILLKNPYVDPRRVAVIGYCFGGMVALELARGGAPLAGVVTFHGALDTPTPGEAKNIKAKVLALHGADDPYVTAAQVAAFEDEMRKGRVDWQLVKYGGAVHAFTNPASGNDPTKGVAYNEKADQRSWEAMKEFFAEIFR